MMITGSTKILFMLAHPAGKIRATHMLNRYLAEHGKDAVILPLDVKSPDLGDMLDAIRRLDNVAGFAVTMPHKIGILDHLDEVTGSARAIGAVNFVRRNRDGSLSGTNLDGQGFVEGLRANGVSVAGKRVLQVGAGGAGRSVATALAAAGAGEIFVVNRDAAKAEQLAARLVSPSGAGVGRSGVEIPTDVDLIVNTTSLGMKPDDPLPFDPSLVLPSQIVCDIIISPPVTPFMEAAARRGARVIGGQPMFEGQMGLLVSFLDL